MRRLRSAHPCGLSDCESTLAQIGAIAYIHRLPGHVFTWKRDSACMHLLGQSVFERRRAMAACFGKLLRPVSAFIMAFATLP